MFQLSNTPLPQVGGQEHVRPVAARQVRRPSSGQGQVRLGVSWPSLRWVPQASWSHHRGAGQADGLQPGQWGHGHRHSGGLATLGIDRHACNVLRNCSLSLVLSSPQPSTTTGVAAASAPPTWSTREGATLSKVGVSRWTVSGHHDETERISELRVPACCLEDNLPTDTVSHVTDFFEPFL